MTADIRTSIPKKEINNYFEGALPELSTVFYGGEPYCNYFMKYTNIRVQIKDLKDVGVAKVTLVAILF